MEQERINELDELLGAMRDGQLTELQAARLDALVADDVEARRYYIDFVNLCADLKQYHGSGEPALEKLQSIASRGGRDWAPGPGRSAWRTLALAAAVAIAASLVTIWVMPAPPSPWALGEGEGVAVVTRMAEARWESGSMQPQVGMALTPGTLSLESGLAQIEFYSGATVVLEGPAEFQVISPQRGFFHRGKVRAHVPPQARGFTIGAPGVDVVDLGTEFAIRIDESGEPEVHVLDGEVRLEGAGPRQTLTTGQGVRLVDGRRETIRADEHAFINPAKLAGLADAFVRQRRIDWLEQSIRLSQDPGVVLYYNFEGQQPWERTLENRAVHAIAGSAGGGGPSGSRSDGAEVGAIVGASWSNGRWPGKSALEFKRTSDRVRITVPGRHAAMTFAAWVRFDGFDRQWNSLMLTDGWEPGEPHWQISAEGEIILGVKLNEASGVNFYSPKGVLGPADLGRWIHLVTVYDSQQGTATHYVDGRAIATSPTYLGAGASSQTPRPALEIGAAEIGNWAAWNHPQETDARNIRNLNGRIDELMLFNRAMTGAEVQSLYDAGKP